MKMLHKSVIYELLVYIIGGRLSEAFFPKVRQDYNQNGGDDDDNVDGGGHLVTGGGVGDDEDDAT